MKAQPVRIYHNPRCTKSREMLALLRARGLEPEVIEYLNAPLSATEVKALIRQLGVEPHAVLRNKEDAYKTLKLSKSSSLDEIANAIAKQPILLERPVVVVGNRAAIGRPAENALKLFDAEA